MSDSRYLERSFPIVQLNPLSVRERNAFKPVYKMHKWFARRSSSTFRAILLGAALPYEEEGSPIDLMAEFYRGHVDDPRLRRADGTPLRVLDPFMGGGTTVVEALRLGFDVIGVDYNPIAWFVVKGETTPVDLDALDAGFARVAAKVKEELLDLYRTVCPLTRKPADIIYGFWVKQGVCVDPGCLAVTDLFKSYVVGQIQGNLGLFYYPDVTCPGCAGIFDWEVERCTITAGGPQVLGTAAAGLSRSPGTAFAFGLEEDGVRCPHCDRHATRNELVLGRKSAKKKVLVRALLDPSTGDFFEVRGDLPARVTAPLSGHVFDPNGGPVDGGKFSCQCCGRKQDIVESARARGKPLPFRYYGFYAYTPHVPTPASRQARELGLPTNNDKWFAAVGPADVAKVESAAHELDRVADTLPLPHQQIVDGYNTNRLVIHQYRRWSELYGPRQLLALGKLLRAIAEESDASVRDALLGAFQSHLDNVSHLAAYHVNRNMPQRVTAAHDYRNPTTIVESNVWGVADGVGAGPFRNCVAKVREGLEYLNQPDLTGESETVPVNDRTPDKWQVKLVRGSATDIPAPAGLFDLVVTDPPYAGLVQYAEMSDWSYVWLHHVLKDVYPDEFGPEITLKSQEIIEDGGFKDPDFYFGQLTEAWRESHRVLKDDGLLVFTFHHKEGDRWTGLLRSLFDAGFYLVAAYPTHSEALNSIVIQATKGITYDIVHVCRKRRADPEPIPWSALRREVQREARAQLREIEQGTDVLPGPDVQMILLGKALMRFSEHYGKVLDADGVPMDLDEAMERILLLVREVRGEELPLPSSLQDVDSLTQISLLHVVGKGPWTRDGLHIELRGYAHGSDTLLDAGLLRERSGQRGQIEAVPPLERATTGSPSARADGPLIDKMHLLLARVAAGRPVDDLLKAWRGRWAVIGDALAWLGRTDPACRDLAGLTLRTIEAAGPDLPAPKPEQLHLFS